MSKIVMPKHSANLEETIAVLKHYYEAGGWQGNAAYKETIKSIIGADQYSSSYTKKLQVTSYFGFTEWEDIKNSRSPRRITDSGRRFYEAIRDNSLDALYDEIMLALETVNFGRNNFGSPESDSDIQPPNLFIRAALDLGHLTYKEFAFIIECMAYKGIPYARALSEIRQRRLSKTAIVLIPEAGKFADPKPIMMLVRWGFLKEIEGGKIVVNPVMLERFKERLLSLQIANDFSEIETDDDTREQNSIQRASQASSMEIERARTKALNFTQGSKGKSIAKDSRISKAALVDARYECQIDASHKTFLTPRRVPYMEGHHLIPCTVKNSQEIMAKLGKNIDCLENIICVCPNCHRAVHFGDAKTKAQMIALMFSRQEAKLCAAGIHITLEELLSRYSW